MSNPFFISHIFFFTALLALIAALIVVLRQQHNQWKPILYASLPIVMIFITAYLGKHIPMAHQIFNIFYNALIVFNAYHFWSTAQRLTYYIYLFAIVSTALDFAMHFIPKSS